MHHPRIVLHSNVISDLFHKTGQKVVHPQNGVLQFVHDSNVDPDHFLIFVKNCKVEQILKKWHFSDPWMGGGNPCWCVYGCILGLYLDIPVYGVYGTPTGMPAPSASTCTCTHRPVQGSTCKWCILGFELGQGPGLHGCQTLFRG